MESLQMLMNGFSVAIQPGNLAFALIGCMVGTLVGVLPGVGPAAAMAMLIPITFVLDPIPAIIMLTAIYYGAMYGGTITSVLINTPGEAASAITCIEGYEMAKRGRAGAALAISAIGSYIGSIFAIMGLVLLAMPLATLGLKFGPPEMFALMVMGLSLVTALAGKSVVRALASASLGMLVAMVGIDPVLAAPRFTFGQIELSDGVSLVPVVMGMFGVGEILLNIEVGAREMFKTKMSHLIPTWRDMKDSSWPIVRGTFIGFFLGLIPGIGAVIATVASYVAEKKLSKTPERFGTGMIEGVAGPETANNSHHIAHLIPLFTLGIPASATAALIMGALMMNGLIPGPLLFKDHADFVWAIIASFFIGNTILLVLNLPLIPLWVTVLKIPYSILFAMIIGFCVFGVYSLDNSTFDIWMLLAFGVVGYVFRKLDFPLAPFVVTLILGPLMEKGLRRTLSMSDGDFTILFTRPVPAILLALSVAFIIMSALQIAKSVKPTDVEV